MRDIEAVTFDLWDTLIQERPGGSDTVARLRVTRIGAVLAGAGLPHEDGDIMAAHERTGQFLRMVWAEHRDVPVMEQVLFMLGTIDKGIPGRLRTEDMTRIERAYSDSILENPPLLLPGAREALARVRDSGYRMGLISNTGRTPGSTLRSLMERMSIIGFFDTATFSNEILLRKPAEGAFRTTLDALKAAPEDAVHVGDDPESDVGGAKRVGMAAVQVVADGREPSPEADLAVRSLEEFADAIGRL